MRFSRVFSPPLSTGLLVDLVLAEKERAQNAAGLVLAELAVAGGDDFVEHRSWPGRASPRDAG